MLQPVGETGMITPQHALVVRQPPRPLRLEVEKALVESVGVVVALSGGDDGGNEKKRKKKKKRTPLLSKSEALLLLLLLLHFPPFNFSFLNNETRVYKMFFFLL